MAGSIFIDLVLIVCSFWAFIDAASNRVGSYKISDGINKGYKNGASPVVWGIGSFFLIPFVIYLFRRKKLIEDAKENPVDTDKSRGFIIIFIVVAAIQLYAYREVLFS
ncbi:hypothetical protein [Serratia liquefaciens]|uniref:hypothetical protein n=1 Tax=Serratia liquefaciens TaxID=614 RepID=UPI0021C58560|nr:hypothetical protein [Serratia liquefaciens]